MGLMRFPQGLKSALEALRSGASLLAGEVRYTTDEGRLYLAKDVNAMKPIVVADSYGTAGQVLTSNGGGADPTFQAAQGGFKEAVYTSSATGVITSANAGRDIVFEGFGSTITIPSDASDPIPVGSFFRVHARPHISNHVGLILVPAAGVSVAADNGVFIPRGSSAVLVKRTATSWQVFLDKRAYLYPEVVYQRIADAGLLPFQTYGVEAGDLLILATETPAQAVSVPTGFTEAPNSPQTTGTAGSTTATRLHVFYKVATGTETEVQPVSSSSYTQDHVVCAFLHLKNVDTGSIFNVTAGAVASTATTAVSMPTVTTTRDATLVISIVTWATDTSFSEFTLGSTPLASPSLTQGGTTVGNGGGLGIIVGNKNAAGSVAATTGTLATASTQARWTGAINVK